MPSALSLSKTRARTSLRKMMPLKLEYDVFFIPGWTDQGCLAWIEPYTEGGTSRRLGWEYTIRDWAEKILDAPSQQKIHFVKLLKNEEYFHIERFQSGPREGKVRFCNWEQDETYSYENFFQFAELLKETIRASRCTRFDLVGHSMGGLDIAAALTLDPNIDSEPEVKHFIKTSPLSGARNIITFSTPFRGSPGGWLVRNTKLDEIFMRSWSKGIRSQAEAMSPDSPFIKIITNPQRQKRLVKNISGVVYTFGSDNDKAVPSANRMIDGAINYPPADFSLAQHSQRMGIPQDPRTALELFRILIKN